VNEAGQSKVAKEMARQTVAHVRPSALTRRRLARAALLTALITTAAVTAEVRLNCLDPGETAAALVGGLTAGAAVCVPEALRPRGGRRAPLGRGHGTQLAVADAEVATPSQPACLIPLAAAFDCHPSGFGPNACL